MLDEETKQVSGPGGHWGGCSLWFLGGIALSFTTICALVLFILLGISTAFNAYLGWELSGLEITISRATPVLPAGAVVTPTTVMVMAPVSTSTPMPLSTTELVEAQVGTVAAIATQVVASAGTPIPLPTAALLPPPTLGAIAPTASSANLNAPAAEFNPPPAMAAAAAAPSASSSNNTYNLIPIEGERESRPAEEHGDLNLKLRDPQPINVELAVVDVGAGVDPDAPSLSAIFKPEFKAAYTIYDWDWGCNCKGKLIEDKSVALAGLKTTPGQPVYIPPRQQDIYGGKYLAVVLYASENSLTFVYARAGSMVKGYAVHYLGLQTDPNLVKLFRESKGSELPGLAANTPVGLATDELIVAIRDNGKFLDARSKNDWWK